MSKIKVQSPKTKAKAEEAKSLAKTKGGPKNFPAHKSGSSKRDSRKANFLSGLLIWQIPRNQEEPLAPLPEEGRGEGPASTEMQPSRSASRLVGASKGC